MKTRIIAVSILFSILFYVGCGDSFLNIEPPSTLTTESFYQTQEDALSAVNATYASLQTLSMYSDDYAKLIETGLDDIQLHNTGGLTLDSWSFDATQGQLDRPWQACYEGVFRANLVLQEVPNIEMDETLKNRLLAEARFMRALYYWHLSSLFGEVPLITEADPTDVSKAEVGKSPVGDIYELMINDLEFASNNLPLKSEYGDSDLGRASKGAAQSLLGKVYLYSENYEMAETYFDQVMDSNEYQLLEDFSDLWVQDNNTESIFEVQYASTGGGAWAGNDGPGNSEGNLRLRLNLPQGRGGFANLLPTQDLVDEYENHSGETAINGRDPRLFYSIFRDGDPYDSIDPEYDENWTPTGYTMKKGMYPVLRNEDHNYRNTPLIRFGDVILMAAEAANENNNPEKALGLLNQIRDRVGMPNYPTLEYPATTQREIFDAIVHERRVELAFEYHRLNDLRRWGIAEQELEGYESPKHRYFPIPQQEVDTNSELEQNPNY